MAMINCHSRGAAHVGTLSGEERGDRNLGVQDETPLGIGHGENSVIRHGENSVINLIQNHVNRTIGLYTNNPIKQQPSMVP
jgi:hypothetical protein